MFKSPIFKAFDFLLSIPIVHDIMFGIYRQQIVEKSEKMGLPWTEFMNEQWDSLGDLKSKAEEIEDPNVTIPKYYYAPIHAYKDGNLCWESAMEEDLWSKLMIAPLYNNALDGDVQMRQKWLSITDRALGYAPKFATDLGCGTGLSMYMLDSKWPSIEAVKGVDLSTYKLAVCTDKKSLMVRKISVRSSTLVPCFSSCHVDSLLQKETSTTCTTAQLRIRRLRATLKTWCRCAWSHMSHLNGFRRIYLPKHFAY